MGSHLQGYFLSIDALLSLQTILLLMIESSRSQTSIIACEIDGTGNYSYFCYNAVRTTVYQFLHPQIAYTSGYTLKNVGFTENSKSYYNLSASLHSDVFFIRITALHPL